MKPTQEQILSALNKLMQESKTELKSEKIELGMVDDAKKLMQTSKKLIDSIKENEKIYKVLTKSAGKQRVQGNKLYDTIKDLYTKFSKAAKELGVDNPKEIDDLWTSNVELARYTGIASDIEG